ncbi:hypothetical protein V5O48_007951 [Marasmius crinis-equi]|uniref:NADP-dependent oxidoreductase domain-containing protein n=1 Tax=Marasmius crinis-equi TaxID=585013 RepID=A0ABR3FFE4_9AGAR
MGFGDPKWLTWVADEEQGFKVLMIKAAWDRGINTIDTANLYSNGGSERVVGNFLKKVRWLVTSKPHLTDIFAFKYNIPRNQFIIATKCCGLVADEPEVFTPTAPPSFLNQRKYINQHGLSRTAIFNQVEESLERLQTTYIDLYQIHRFDPNTPAEETMKALHDLVESGKVRYIGASSMRAWEFAHLNEVAARNGWTEFVSMQDEYSLLYREEEREMHAYCNFNGIGIIPWGPLTSGQLTRPADSSVVTARLEAMKGTPWGQKLQEADCTIIQRVEEIAKKRGVPMAQVALAWIALKVTSPIIGTSSVERLEENIVPSDFTLTGEEVKYIPKPVRGHA